MTFTETEQRILDLLSDGHGHSKQELVGCLYTGSVQTLQKHLSNMRRKLQAVGEDILCSHSEGRLYYNHIRRIFMHG